MWQERNSPGRQAFRQKGQLTMQGRFYTLKSLGIRVRRAKKTLLRAVRNATEIRSGSHGRPGQGRRFSGIAMRRLRGAIGWPLAFAVLALAGCAIAPAGIDKNASAEDKQKIVAARAEARWEALIKGDLGTAYTFLSPGSKTTTSLDLYKAKTKPGMWRAAKADKVSCEAEVCTVAMLITFDTKQMKGIQTPVTESWIIEDGAAWYVYR
jgi:hypothetical protein